MARMSSTIKILHCQRCQHAWLPRGVVAGKIICPLRCPKCKSAYWDRPRSRIESKAETMERLLKQSLASGQSVAMIYPEGTALHDANGPEVVIASVEVSRREIIAEKWGAENDDK